MRKKILEKRLARLNEKRANLVARSQASTDVNEVRDIQALLEDVDAEIAETREEIEAIDAATAEATANVDEQRSAVPANAQLVNGNVVGSFPMATENRENDDPFASMEYRKAFMEYAKTGKEIPTNLYQRDGAPANTDSLGATIPTTVLKDRKSVV